MSHHLFDNSFSEEEINPTKLKYMPPVRYILTLYMLKCEGRKCILKAVKICILKLRKSKTLPHPDNGKTLPKI